MLAKFRFIGLGGHGISLMGNILGRAFAIYEELNAVQSTFYSAAVRGGLVWSDVIAGDEELYDIAVDYPDYFVVTSKKAITKNMPLIKNSKITLIKDEKNITRLNENNVVYIDTMKTVREHNLPEYMWNIFLLGYISRLSNIIHCESLEKSILDLITKNSDENIRALKIGYSK